MRYLVVLLLTAVMTFTTVVPAIASPQIPRVEVKASNVSINSKTYDDTLFFVFDVDVENLTGEVITLHDISIELLGSQGQVIRTIDVSSRIEIEAYGVLNPCHALLFRTTKNQLRITKEARLVYSL